MDIEKKLEEGKGDHVYSEILLKGTNISIREVLRELAHGKSVDEILKENPEITMANIQTCFEYAFELVGAINFRNATDAINVVVKKRQTIIDKLESLKINLDSDASGV